MEDKINISVSDDKRLASIMGNNSMQQRWKLSGGDFEKREQELLPAANKLPPDHLTATYWG